MPFSQPDVAKRRAVLPYNNLLLLSTRLRPGRETDRLGHFSNNTFTMKKHIRIFLLRQGFGGQALLLLLVLSAAPAFAQRENVWLGGKPGRPTDWNTAANWSKGRVPNEFDDVRIPCTATTTRAYPVIASEVEVQSIWVEPGAEVQLAAGLALVIHWEGRDGEGFLKVLPAEPLQDSVAVASQEPVKH